MSRSAGCGVTVPGGRRCAAALEPDAPLALCVAHLLEAHDWVARRVGVTDVLPSPCLACGSRLGVRYPSGWLCAICEWRVGELPDHEAPETRMDVVYYIRARDRIKIGTSGNPRMRLASLHYEELLAFEPGGRALEQRRHAQFGEQRIPGGEWFHVHDALLQHIADLAIGVDDPWARYSYWVSRSIAAHS